VGAFETARAWLNLNQIQKITIVNNGLMSAIPSHALKAGLKFPIGTCTPRPVRHIVI